MSDEAQTQRQDDQLADDPIEEVDAELLPDREAMSVIAPRGDPGFAIGEPVWDE